MRLQLQSEKLVNYVIVIYDIILCVLTQFNFGEIAGFSVASVELLFSPNEVGEYSQHFQITFSHPSVAPVSQTTFVYIDQ